MSIEVFEPRYEKVREDGETLAEIRRVVVEQMKPDGISADEAMIQIIRLLETSGRGLVTATVHVERANDDRDETGRR
jgi:hypothetical protein